jgi:peptide/nickel transport system substrate-binding protein
MPPAVVILFSDSPANPLRVARTNRKPAFYPSLFFLKEKNMHRKWTLLVVLMLALSAFLVACGQQEVREIIATVETVVEREVTRVVPGEGEQVVVVETVVVTEIETVIVEATPVPVDRNGAWIDTVVVVQEPNIDAGVARLIAGDIDVYANTIGNAATAATIFNSDLRYSTSYGSYNELSFNTVVFDSGKLNPFNDPTMREAMNWLVDRSYLVSEVAGGLAVPRFVAVNGASADRARLATEIRAIEAMYAYDMDRAAEVFAVGMTNLGAELVGGKWQYEGEPVEIIILIRTEDERRQVGDYVGTQLEEIGFTVVYDYKTAAEASPIWLSGNPADGLFHIYTGGWISTAISRDVGDNFEFFYTPSGLPRPLWQTLTPAPEFEALATRLATNDFATIEERTALFAEILPLSMQDSARVWLYDRTSIAPYGPDIEVGADLSGSISGSAIWPHTLRRSGQLGGSVTWAMPSILSEAWNPIAGSNWIFDMSLIRATGDFGTLPDPNTGLHYPQRIATGSVVAREGLPVGKTLDWVGLEFASEIAVPDDAWVDWDAEAGVFITAAEKFTETQTAAMKVTVVYPDDLYDTITWHDGSPFSAADIVMRMIVTFDRAKEASWVYDAASVSAFNSFMSAFKGAKIVSLDPLTIESYTDNWTLDAEVGVANWTWWPYYAQGPASWHALTLGLLADSQGLSAFSPAKAGELDKDTLNYISGPVLAILKEQLSFATEENFIPYANTLGDFISEDEAAARYANIATFNSRRGHFWVGTGPFFLQRAFPVEGTAILERYTAYPDSSDKWARFSAPAIAEVDVDGDSRVTLGQPASFDVFVDFQGEPYPTADLTEVKYLLFDAAGTMVASGNAEAVEDGLWSIALSGDQTRDLGEGSSRVEVVVVSKVVALPSLGSYSFVTAP